MIFGQNSFKPIAIVIDGQTDEEHLRAIPRAPHGYSWRVAGGAPAHLDLKFEERARGDGLKGHYLVAKASKAIAPLAINLECVLGNGAAPRREMLAELNIALLPGLAPA